MRSLAIAALLLALGSPALARAEATPTVSDGARTPVAEVERGGYAETEVGGVEFFGIGAGTAVSVDVGWDITRAFGLGLFASGISVGAPALPGDVSAVFPGVEARLYLPLSEDANGIQRLFLGLRGGGGVMLFSPIGGLTGSDPAIRLGANLEYFTRLRHFSLGLGADALVLLGSNVQLGVVVSPFARYSF
ncbi:MAG: adventurous gliding motility protein CglE [Deltaproteobacteria bacterium]